MVKTFFSIMLTMLQQLKILENHIKIVKKSIRQIQFYFLKKVDTLIFKILKD